MEYLKIIKEFNLFGNGGMDYFWFFVVLISLIFVFKLFQVVVLFKLKAFSEKTKTDLDDLLVSIIKKIKPYFYTFISFYIATLFLDLSSTFESALAGLFILVVVFQVMGVLSELIKYIAGKISKDGSSASIAEGMMLVAKIVIWSFAVVLILSNWGINVTSLIAGLGIGGIAIALAAQKILSDIFSSFSIFIDKPFEVGDFIVVGSDSGVVQKVGIKSTRIKTLQGEELVVSNQDLTNERIRNFKKMEKRRVVFSLGVTYETSKEKLKRIPKIIKDIVEKEELAKFDRTHFKSYGDSSLNFEVVYYVNVGDYGAYMDINQNINMSIFEEFEKEGIEFAYPTQTIFVKK